MSYKGLIVCDNDGTLLPYGKKEIDKKTLDVIRALILNGISFAWRVADDMRH